MAEPMHAEIEEAVEIQLEETEQPNNQNEIVVEETNSAAKSDEAEIADYSDSVKKRINKLTYKIREAERREVAALEYAKGVQEKLNNTQATLSQKDKNLYSAYRFLSFCERVA